MTRLSTRGFVASLSLIALLFASRSTRAQSTAPGFALDRFEPSGGGSQWFTLESLDFRGNARPAIGLFGDWAYKPLVIFDGNDKELAPVVEQQLQLHLGVALNLFNRLRLGASLPVAVYQSGKTGTLDGVSYEAPDSAAVGDLRVGADLRLAGDAGGPIVLAVGTYVFFPTGDRSKYNGDGQVRVAPRLMLAGDLGPVAWATRVGVQLRRKDQALFPGLGNELTGGAALGVHLGSNVLIGPEVYASSLLEGGHLLAGWATPFEVLFGAHFTIERDWHLGVGAGPGISDGLGTPRVRALVQLEYFPAVSAPSDRDRDGILDGDDACPDEPGPRTNDLATNGCPVRKPKVADRDHDGILDGDDACPDLPGVKTDDPKTNGCPLVADRDKDGIPDAEDACPDVPGVKTDDPKTNGCVDRDKDGIYDPLDACPDVAGPADPDPTKNGCPKARVDKGQIRILEQVKFKTGSAEILPESDEILQAVLRVFQEHEEIKKVRVEGHTDNRGTAAYNKALSNRRAAAVVKWLTGHGVDGSRMTSQGFGFDKPIGTNKTEEGRQANRRVELHIVDPPQADDAP